MESSSAPSIQPPDDRRERVLGALEKLRRFSGGVSPARLSVIAQVPQDDLHHILEELRQEDKALRSPNGNWRAMGMGLPEGAELEHAQGKEHVCPDCGRVFSRPQALGRHRSASHAPAPPKESKRKGRAEHPTEPTPAIPAPLPSSAQPPRAEDPWPLEYVLTIGTHDELVVEQGELHEQIRNLLDHGAKEVKVRVKGVP